MNAPGTFQAFINTTLREHLDIFIIAYLDDILIYTKRTLEDHIQLVNKVLKALQGADIRLRPEKCEFHIKEIKFLESVITTNGIQMDKEKVRAVKK